MTFSGNFTELEISVVRKQLTPLLDGVMAHRSTILVTRYGRPLAVICDLEDFQAGQDAIKALEADRKRFYAASLQSGAK